MSLRIRAIPYLPHQKDEFEIYRWLYREIFFIDRDTLVVSIPSIDKLDLLQDNRIVVFEITMNDGHDWTSNESTSSLYTFKETPQLLTLSHY